MPHVFAGRQAAVYQLKCVHEYWGQLKIGLWRTGAPWITTSSARSALENSTLKAS